MERDTSAETTRERELVDRSIALTSLTEALQYGLTEGNIRTLTEEVSDSIAEYNRGHESEMLPKSPETIYNQFALGLSCMIVAHDGQRYRFLHHGSVYPVFEQREEQLLKTQIVEFGSEITQKDFRKGFGLGTRGEEVNLKIMKRLATPEIEVFGILTVKRPVTGHVWRKLGVDPISFWKYPYTSFLTDTCSGSSERYGHISCPFRRPIGESTDEILGNLFTKTDGNPYLPCTLLATDHDVLERFEARCRALHTEFGGLPLTENDMSVDSYIRAQQFFDRVTTLATTKN